jgi:hypothetical protein
VFKQSNENASENQSVPAIWTMTYFPVPLLVDGTPSTSLSVHSAVTTRIVK